VLNETAHPSVDSVEPLGREADFLRLGFNQGDIVGFLACAFGWAYRFLILLRPVPA
jgi:hypothetical protein